MVLRREKLDGGQSGLSAGLSGVISAVGDRANTLLVQTGLRKPKEIYGFSLIQRDTEVSESVFKKLIPLPVKGGYIYYTRQDSQGNTQKNGEKSQGKTKIVVYGASKKSKKELEKERLHSKVDGKYYVCSFMAALDDDKKLKEVQQLIESQEKKDTPLMSTVDFNAQKESSFSKNIKNFQQKLELSSSLTGVDMKKKQSNFRVLSLSLGNGDSVYFLAEFKTVKGNGPARMEVVVHGMMSKTKKLEVVQKKKNIPKSGTTPMVYTLDREAQGFFSKTIQTELESYIKTRGVQDFGFHVQSKQGFLSIKYIQQGEKPQEKKKTETAFALPSIINLRRFKTPLIISEGNLTKSVIFGDNFEATFLGKGGIVYSFDKEKRKIIVFGKIIGTEGTSIRLVSITDDKKGEGKGVRTTKEMIEQQLKDIIVPVKGNKAERKKKGIHVEFYSVKKTVKK